MHCRWMESILLIYIQFLWPNNALCLLDSSFSFFCFVACAFARWSLFLNAVTFSLLSLLSWFFLSRYFCSKNIELLLFITLYITLKNIITYQRCTFFWKENINGNWISNHLHQFLYYSVAAAVTDACRLMKYSKSTSEQQRNGIIFFWFIIRNMKCCFLHQTHLFSITSQILPRTRVSKIQYNKLELCSGAIPIVRLLLSLVCLESCRQFGENQRHRWGQSRGRRIQVWFVAN